MISLNISLKNPWKRGIFSNIWCRDGAISTNKRWEFELIKYTTTLVCLKIDTNITGRDHAGVSLELGLFGYQMLVSVYDRRHWDYAANQWLALD